MKPQYLYLTLDLLSILFPFLASFYSKAPFYKKWKYVSLAILIPAILFIAWDEFFTRMNVWGFNPEYLCGIYIGSLPIEEILFFICIPYACVFTYFTLNYFTASDDVFAYHELLSSVLIMVLMIAGIFFMDKAYTALTFILLSLLMAYLMLKIRARYMGLFYVSFAVILIPFLVVNGILTGSFIEGEVVWYDNGENLGLRLATIPIEDIFYAMLLLLMNISIYEGLQARYETSNP